MPRRVLTPRSWCALPVISNYLERLQLADLVDELVPWEGEVPLGTIVAVLVSNRLLNPKALFRIDDWTQQTGLNRYYGLEAGQLNDDRLGRALERLAAHAEPIQAGLVLRAVKKFKLDVSQIHYDITSVELYGAYDRDIPEGQRPPAPRPTYGHAKSGRKNIKQVQLGLNVTGDGGVPVGHVALDGNTAEATTHLDNLRRLRALLPKKWELYIADTKLDTPENLLAIGAARGKFVCGGAFDHGVAATLLAAAQATPPRGLLSQEPGAPAAGAARPVPGLRVARPAGRPPRRAADEAGLSPGVRVESGQGTSGSQHARAARGQDQ